MSLGCIALAGAYGWYEGGSLIHVFEVLWIVLVLAVLEVSLSFDNAVVNAAILSEMSPVWRRRFLTWGMAVAVFGTRIAFPLAIVGITAGLGPIDALRLSLEQPARYEAILKGAHLAIAGFGGAFLLMVALGFFSDADKQLHWLAWPERALLLLGRMRSGGMVLVLAALVLLAHGLGWHEAARFVVAGVLGVVAFLLIDNLGVALEGRQPARATSRTLDRTAACSGLAAFAYLNLLDASFSLDGVIGAFALSNNMIVIALGLSIGAVFVRSLTVKLVETGTLGRYPYLEHGAFWAILALGAIMLASACVEVPEAVTGLVGAALIGAALWSSARSSRQAATHRRRNDATASRSPED